MKTKAVIVAAALTTILACSGDGLTGAAPPQAILAARFDTPDRTDCSAAGSAVSVGMFRDPSPVAVADGARSDLGAYRVACRVVDLGDNRFGVDGTMMLNDRVVFSIKGTFPNVSDVNGFKVDQVTLSNADLSKFAAFTEADGQCTVLYNADRQGAAVGRAWGEVTCQRATNDPAAGGSGTGTCVTIAQFRFENCAR